MTCNTIEAKLSKKITSFLTSRKTEVTINISKLNFLEASKLALLNSTECYVKNPGKKINWIVKNEAIKSEILPYKLDNMEIWTLKKDSLNDKRN